MRLAIALALVALASPTDAVAQELSLRPGQRVRVTVSTVGKNAYEDRFRQLRGDTLVLESAWFPLSDVTQLKVHQGRKSVTGWGGLVGLLGGALTGAIVGYSQGDDHGLVAWTAEQKAGLLAAVFGGVGGLGGLLIGALIRTDKWEGIPLDRLRVSVVPHRDGFGLGASIAF